MKKPHIASREPFVYTLKAGKTYAWCSCGLSKTQPFCDGSHAGTPFVPQLFRCDEDRQVVLCGCKQTKTPPYCDGSHLRLK